MNSTQPGTVRWYRGVRIRKIASKWYPVTSEQWPETHPVRRWHQRARDTTGLNGPGSTGYLTKTQVMAAIDTAITRCGPCPEELARAA